MPTSRGNATAERTSAANQTKMGRTFFMAAASRLLFMFSHSSCSHTLTEAHQRISSKESCRVKFPQKTVVVRFGRIEKVGTERRAVRTPRRGVPTQANCTTTPKAKFACFARRPIKSSFACGLATAVTPSRPLARCSFDLRAGWPRVHWPPSSLS